MGELSYAQANKKLKAKLTTWIQKENEKVFLACTSGWIDLDTEVAEKLSKILPYYAKVEHVVTQNGKRVKSVVVKEVWSYKPLYKEDV